MPRCRPVGVARCRPCRLPHIVGCVAGAREDGRPECFHQRCFPRSPARCSLPSPTTSPPSTSKPAVERQRKWATALSLDATLRQCLADENSARDQLENQWTQFPPALPQPCLVTTETGGDPSYVEVLVCLQMGRDAAQMEDPLGGGRQDKK